LTYCLNVHPGETWHDAFAAIREHAEAVRRRVRPSAPFGLGLRLGDEAARQLSVAAELDAFKDYLAGHGLYVFTINGFPFGRFHGTRVKEDVYRPDWRAPDRLAYTERLARLLAALLPDGVTGSISTVPVSYKPWLKAPSDLRAAASNLAALADTLARIRDETGREIHVGLEPEPDCAVETTAEAIRFFERDLDAEAARRLGPRSDALRRHIGVCLDTCHAAMQFEDPAESLRRLAAAEIRVSKIQISAALAADGATARRELGRFLDPVYLHQVRVRRSDGRFEARADLDTALADDALDASPSAEWRVHFHVPLYFEGLAGLGSTATTLAPGFFAEALSGSTEHLEIETYTFGVLPEPLRTRSVSESFSDEFRWVLDRIRACQPRGQPA
jgi:sugar phosphate isomerase/epimerase